MLCRCTVALLLWLACVGAANGGEIVITPVARSKDIPPVANDKIKPVDATTLRNKAREYKSGNVSSVTSSGIPAIIQTNATSEIEEGVMLPRGDEIPAAPRTGNRELFRDNIPSMQDARPSDNDAEPNGRQNAQQQLEKNRFKASQYMKGKPAPSVVSSHNSDNQVVACESSGNVSGRIGDDSMSGREVVVIRDGKQVKMHCK